MQLDIENYLNNLCCVTTPVTSPTIFYNSFNFTFEIGVPVNVCPTITGDLPIIVSINKTLPAGLSVDLTTGCITGTPTAVTASDSYEVQAVNAGGSFTAFLVIEVINPFITITNGGFGTAATAQTYLDLYSTTYTDFSYDVANDIMSWKEPVNTSYTAFQFMTSLINGLASGATFSDQKGLITSFGFKSFQFVSTNHTFANGITFGDGNFHGLSANLTFGDNCNFGNGCFISAFSTTGLEINFGNNNNFNNTTTDSLANFDSATFNFKNINSITTRLGVNTNCTYNFNGDLGGSTGADFTNPDWIDVMSINPIINARISDQTSNGGAPEEDLDNLTNSGFTVNYIL